VSVERVVRSNGEVVWRVRWREGERNRSRVLGRKRDADAFDAEVRRRRRTGELAALDAGRETLAHFAETWWQLYALPNLAPRTRASYAHIWDRHVLPRLGALPLREIDTLVVGRLAAVLGEPEGAYAALAAWSGRHREGQKHDARERAAYEQQHREQEARQRAKAEAERASWERRQRELQEREALAAAEAAKLSNRFKRRLLG
jgi:hypothetical protein